MAANNTAVVFFLIIASLLVVGSVQEATVQQSLVSRAQKKVAVENTNLHSALSDKKSALHDADIVSPAIEEPPKSAEEEDTEMTSTEATSG